MRSTHVGRAAVAAVLAAAVLIAPAAASARNGRGAPDHAVAHGQDAASQTGPRALERMSDRARERMSENAQEKLTELVEAAVVKVSAAAELKAEPTARGRSKDVEVFGRIVSSVARLRRLLPEGTVMPANPAQMARMIEEAVAAARASAATDAGVDPSAVTVTSVKTLLWSDEAYGCPDGGDYDATTAFGYAIELSIDGAAVSYHGTFDGEPFRCDNPDLSGALQPAQPGRPDDSDDSDEPEDELDGEPEE
jgi:hypothetical protein